MFLYDVSIFVLNPIKLSNCSIDAVIGLKYEYKREKIFIKKEESMNKIKSVDRE